jgi:hypothetical protein
MASVECPRCRGKIDPRSTRCRFCHADFSSVEQEALRKEHGSRKILLAILGIILFFGAVSQCRRDGTIEEKSAVSEKRPSSDDSMAVEATNNALDGVVSPTKVAGETESVSISVPSDPGATYRLISRSRLRNGNLEAVTRRDGRSGTSFTRREIDCGAMTFRYLGEGDTLAQALADGPNPGEMAELTTESISTYVSEFVCRKAGR